MNKKTDDVWVIIPAFNEAAVLGRVVGSVTKSGPYHVLVIDDGSTDDSATKAAQAGAIVLRHRLNRGKGAAVKTGMQAALLQGADIIVTFDGDGQHDAADIARLITPLVNQNYDVVLGSRFLAVPAPQVPGHKRTANRLANVLTLTFYGMWVSDSQCGLRAFSRRAAKLIDTKTDAYAYDSEVIREIRRHRLRFTEIPVKVRYTSYAQQKKHRQNLGNGIKTVYKMMWNALS